MYGQSSKPQGTNAPFAESEFLCCAVVLVFCGTDRDKFEYFNCESLPDTIRNVFPCMTSLHAIVIGRDRQRSLHVIVIGNDSCICLVLSTADCEI